jgi:uncharacterized protein YheU (UPF0270 family)
MKKPAWLKTDIPWDELSEKAKRNIEECDLVRDGSGPEYTEEMRLEEKRIRENIQKLNKVKRGRAN